MFGNWEINAARGLERRRRGKRHLEDLVTSEWEKIKPKATSWGGRKKLRKQIYFQHGKRKVGGERGSSKNVSPLPKGEAATGK